MAYEYNSKAFYNPFGKYEELVTKRDLTQLEIVVQDDNKKSTSFSLKLPDSIYDLSVYKYLTDGDYYDGGGFQTAKSSYNFQHDPMKLWETQLNFAVHCSTSGLGISTEHFNAKQPLVRVLYRFHVYYHIRRILRRMLVPTPSEDGFDKYNNTYSLENVLRVGDEYGCSTRNLGIYRNDFYFDRSGTSKSGFAYEHNNWSRWIMNSSHGFTKYGLEKISESIRAYSYLILTSQASARHGMLGDTAQSLVAQRLFYDNLEDIINKAVSLEDDIGRYQSTLKYARSRLDYSVGNGLYMLPSDMLLKPLNQVIEGYNDKIVISTSGLELGKYYEPVKHIPATPAKHTPAKYTSVKHIPAKHVFVKQVVHQVPLHTLDDHNDEVQALVLAIGGLALFVIWWIK